MANKDLKIRISETLDERLRALATEYGLSYNEVAAQILETYSVLWQEAEEVKHRKVQEQLGKARASTTVTPARHKIK